MLPGILPFLDAMSFRQQCCMGDSIGLHTVRGGVPASWVGWSDSLILYGSLQKIFRPIFVEEEGLFGLWHTGVYFVNRKASYSGEHSSLSE